MGNPGAATLADRTDAVALRASFVAAPSLLTVFLIVMAAGYGAAVAAIDLPWLKRWFVWLPVCGLAAVAVVLLAVRRSLIPTTLRSLMPLAAWSLPVGLLLAYNQIAIGAITGYHPTGEGNDFRLEFFFDNWRNALDQLTDRGMLFVFPLAIAAMIGMFFYRWRLGLVMALWILPTIGVYMLYYWAPVSPDVGYLRFFLGTFPAIALCAAWVLTLPTRLPALRKTPDTPRPAGAIGLQLAGCATLAVLTIGAASFALHRTHWFMERDKITNTNLAARGEIIRKVIPDDSVVFVSGFMVRTPANYIQFIGDYQLYDPQEFSTRGREFTNAEDEPSWEDPHRRQARSERRSRLGRNGLREERDRLIQQALSQGRRVFVVDDGADSALAVEIGRGSLQYGRIESYKDTLPTKRRGNPERGFRVRDNRNNLRTVESATYWSIYEITQRESATLPASAMSY